MAVFGVAVDDDNYVGNTVATNVAHYGRGENVLEIIAFVPDPGPIPLEYRFDVVKLRRALTELSWWQG